MLDNVTNLGTLDDSGTTTNTTALANIYKMFAAEGNSFSNNGDLDGTNNKPTKNKAWLPTTQQLNETNFTDKAYHVNFNGIK